MLIKSQNNCQNGPGKINNTKKFKVKQNPTQTTKSGREGNTEATKTPPTEQKLQATLTNNLHEVNRDIMRRGPPGSARLRHPTTANKGHVYGTE